MREALPRRRSIRVPENVRDIEVGNEAHDASRVVEIERLVVLTSFVAAEALSNRSGGARTVVLLAQVIRSDEGAAHRA